MPDLSQTPDEQIVTMTIPVEESQMPNPQNAGLSPTTDLSNPIQKGGEIVEPIQSGNIENPQDIPQENCICFCHGKREGQEAIKNKCEHCFDFDKGQPICRKCNNTGVIRSSMPGGGQGLAECDHDMSQPISPKNSKEEKPKDLGGRPCLYCENKDKYQKIADEYIAWSLVEQGDKRRIPYTEELAIKLGHHRESIMNWANNKDEHPQFFDTIKILQTIQALRLQQRTMGRYNPGGAIFLLKANHGYMESEKKILAGDRTEPLTIEIIEEDK